MELINWSLVKQPTNWFTVVLMLLIAGAAFHLFFTHWQNQTAD